MMVLDLCFCLFFGWWHSEISFRFHTCYELVFLLLFIFNFVPLRMRGGENCGTRGKLKF